MPFGLSAPLQPPEAVHPRASVLLQLRVELSPDATVLGAAVRVIIGWEAPTETTTTWEAIPPGPVQFSVKSFVSLRAPVSADPAVDIAPLQPPLASQELALSADQTRVALSPTATELGVADSVIAGAGLPPAPPQPANTRLSVSETGNMARRTSSNLPRSASKHFISKIPRLKSALLNKARKLQDLTRCANLSPKANARSARTETSLIERLPSFQFKSRHEKSR